MHNLNSKQTSQQRLPVTVISGFLGAGKTSLLQHVLTQRNGLKIALIVNDMSEINLDSQFLQHGQGSLSRADEQLVEMQNGCICCTLREDLLNEVTKLAKQGRFDALLIESSGISEPLPVAETFTFVSEDGSCLSDVARLDTMVTVVDAYSLLQDIASDETLAERNLASTAEDERTIADLLIDQIEFANVLVLNKIDLIPQASIAILQAALQRLNPKATILTTQHGQIPLDAIINTQLFDFEEAATSPGWLLSLRGQEVAETDSYGVGSFVFRARRPFHPERLWQWLQDERNFIGILRSKGFCWLATRMESCGLWTHAGGVIGCDSIGPWYSALPREQWPDDAVAIAEILQDMQDPFGDRRQEMVFIGIDMPQAAIVAQLEQALLTEQEMALGPQSWAQLADPFPPWESATDQHELCEHHEPNSAKS